MQNLSLEIADFNENSVVSSLFSFYPQDQNAEYVQ